MMLGIGLAAHTGDQVSTIEDCSRMEDSWLTRSAFLKTS